MEEPRPAAGWQDPESLQSAGVDVTLVQSSHVGNQHRQARAAETKLYDRLLERTDVLRSCGLDFVGAGQVKPSSGAVGNTGGHRCGETKEDVNGLGAACVEELRAG